MQDPEARVSNMLNNCGVIILQTKGFAHEEAELTCAASAATSGGSRAAAAAAASAASRPRRAAAAASDAKASALMQSRDSNSCSA
jgi:hypothetical protein